MEYQKIQHGDVLLLKVDKETFDAATKGKIAISKHEERAIVAAGEATGHHHAIYNNDIPSDVRITLYKNSEKQEDNVALSVFGGKVPLKHEEHNTLTLDEGYYIQKGVKEFDHMSKLTRRVVD